jgi:Lipase (class 3)
LEANGHSFWHSQGGGVATLLGVLILQEAKKEDFGEMNITELLRVYSYGPPSSVDASLAEFTESFVTTAILHDDVVPRLTPTSCRGLLKHLLHIRETWVKAHLTDDLMAIGERASMAWAPRWRSGFTLASSSKLSLKRSSQSIKKYCQKKISKGTKQLMSVKGKIIAVATENVLAITEGSVAEEKKQETVRESANDKRQCDRVAEIEMSTASDGVLDEDDSLDKGAESTEPKLFLVEMMGGLDNRTDTVVIDGDEFFEADETLIESDEESMATTQMFADALDEARR